MSKVPVYAAKLTAVRKEMLALHDRAQKLKVRQRQGDCLTCQRGSDFHPAHPRFFPLTTSFPLSPPSHPQKRTDKLMSKKKREEMAESIAIDRARQREEALMAKPAEVAVIRATDAAAAKEKRRRSRDN